jgi:hypothetical protein
MANTTYSFDDITAVFSHPSFGQYIATGTGLGSINVAMTTERSAHEVAADGSIMVSKIKGRNGTIATAIQQTSDFNKWLVKLYNYLERAGVTVIIRSPVMQELITLTGVSFQKLPDRPHQAQGQQITWTLMAQDVQWDVV